MGAGLRTATDSDCGKFPIKKGGSAIGAGVVSRGRKAQGSGWRHLVRRAEVRLSPIRKITPVQLCDRCRPAAGPFD